MPHPSSTTAEDEVRMEDSQKGLWFREEIHSANRGVIFQRTALESEVRKKKELHVMKWDFAIR